MNARTEVPEWCRTDVEDAISDAVVRWALRHLDHIAGQTDHDAVHDPLRILRMAISGTRVTVARDVIAALQGVGVPFSGATGAGAEHEKAGPGDDELAYWSPVTGDVFTDRPSWPTTMADGVPGVVPLAATTAIPDPCPRAGCGYGYPWGEPDRCDEHRGMANP